ncbi:hypothetical protein GQ457_01G025410 [Hibiscus cannabinus]
MCCAGHPLDLLLILRSQQQFDPTGLNSSVVEKLGMGSLNIVNASLDSATRSFGSEFTNLNFGRALERVVGKVF